MKIVVFTLLLFLCLNYRCTLSAADDPFPWDLMSAEQQMELRLCLALDVCNVLLLEEYAPYKESRDI